jgi:hypothetical protein
MVLTFSVVTCPVFVVVVYYTSIGFIDTQCRCDCSHMSRHVVTCLCQSLICLQTVEVQGCLLPRCTQCSLSNTAWHLVLTYLARMSSGLHSSSLLRQTDAVLVC